MTKALGAHDDEDRRRMALVVFALLATPIVLLVAFYAIRWAVHHHPVATNAVGLVLLAVAVLGITWWAARRQCCGFCARESTLLCDFPRAAKGKTCDRPLCADHATKKGGGDLCPDHASKWPSAGAAQEKVHVR